MLVYKKRETTPNMLKYIIYVQSQMEDALKKVLYSNTASNTTTFSPDKKKRGFGRLRYNGITKD
jgi:hypothetical protein